MKKRLWLIFAVLSIFLLVACNSDSTDGDDSSTTIQLSKVRAGQRKQLHPQLRLKSVYLHR